LEFLNSIIITQRRIFVDQECEAILNRSCPSQVHPASCGHNLERKNSNSTRTSASPSLLFDLEACLKSSLVKLIRNLAACRMLLYISEGNKLTQCPISFAPLDLWLIHEVGFGQMRPLAALCLAANIDKDGLLDIVQLLDIRNSSHLS
jgi:hypothetical protein